MKKITYTHDHIKEDYPRTHALLDELMDVQLIDNTGEESEDAWRDIERAVMKVVTPLEQEVSFLKGCLRALERGIRK